jgi:hypothetical protein
VGTRKEERIGRGFRLASPCQSERPWIVGGCWVIPARIQGPVRGWRSSGWSGPGSAPTPRRIVCRSRFYRTFGLFRRPILHAVEIGQRLAVSTGAGQNAFGGFPAGRRIENLPGSKPGCAAVCSPLPSASVYGAAGSLRRKAQQAFGSSLLLSAICVHKSVSLNSSKGPLWERNQAFRPENAAPNAPGLSQAGNEILLMGSLIHYSTGV